MKQITQEWLDKGEGDFATALRELRARKAINAEILLLQRSLARTQGKISRFEVKYGRVADRSVLYSHVDDMELIEWEGEVETLKKLQEKLSSLEDIRIEKGR